VDPDDLSGPTVHLLAALPGSGKSTYARSLEARGVAQGRSFVLDHGLGQRAERDAFKRLTEQHGARWRLHVFRAIVRSRSDGSRVAARTTGSGRWTPLLDSIAAGSQEPVREGEEVVDISRALT
jgi:predicted kinase